MEPALDMGMPRRAPCASGPSCSPPRWGHGLGRHAARGIGCSSQQCRLTLTSYYAGLIVALPGASRRDRVVDGTLRDNWGRGTRTASFSDVLFALFRASPSLSANRLPAEDAGDEHPVGDARGHHHLARDVRVVHDHGRGGGPRVPGPFAAPGVCCQPAFVGDGDALAGRRERDRLAGGVADAIGIIIASLSQALQCLIGAPRCSTPSPWTGRFLLARRAFADERRPMRSSRRRRLPVRGLLGSLDLVAPAQHLLSRRVRAQLLDVRAQGPSALGAPHLEVFHWSSASPGSCCARWRSSSAISALVAVALLAAGQFVHRIRAGARGLGSAMGGIRLDRHRRDADPRTRAAPRTEAAAAFAAAGLVSTNARFLGRRVTRNPRSSRRRRVLITKNSRTTRCFETLNTNDDGTTQRRPTFAAAQERARSAWWPRSRRAAEPRSRPSRAPPTPGRGASA